MVAHLRHNSALYSTGDNVKISIYISDDSNDLAISMHRDGLKFEFNSD